MAEDVNQNDLPVDVQEYLEAQKKAQNVQKHINLFHIRARN